MQIFGLGFQFRNFSLLIIVFFCSGIATYISLAANGDASVASQLRLPTPFQKLNYLIFRYLS